MQGGSPAQANDNSKFLDDVVIAAANFPIFCIYAGLIFLVAKKVGIQYIKSPMNYYLAGYFIVFADRFVDAFL